MIPPPPPAAAAILPRAGLTGAISTPLKNVFAAAFRLSRTTYLPLLFVAKRASLRGKVSLKSKWAPRRSPRITIKKAEVCAGTGRFPEALSLLQQENGSD